MPIFLKQILFASIIATFFFSCKSVEFSKRKYIKGKYSINAKERMTVFSKHNQSEHSISSKSSSKLNKNELCRGFEKPKGKNIYEKFSFNKRKFTPITEEKSDPIALKLKSALKICATILLICTIFSCISGLGILFTGSYLMEYILAFSIFFALLDMLALLITYVILIIKW